MLHTQSRGCSSSACMGVRFSTVTGDSRGQTQRTMQMPTWCVSAAEQTQKANPPRRDPRTRKRTALMQRQSIGDTWQYHGSPFAAGRISAMAETVCLPGLVLTEREFDVPLRYSDAEGEQITVFAREVAAPDGRDRPFLVYLQGGPGMEAPRPTAHPSAPGWLERALEDFRVLMLDQRGTGRSTPVANLEGMSPEDQADYLACFRADSIVRDAEFIRNELGVERWSVLGQSFGGFCVLHYMSAAPGGLAEAFLTGGLPPVDRHPDKVYLATYARTLQRCHCYYRATQPIGNGCTDYKPGQPTRRSSCRAGTNSRRGCSASSATCSA